MQKRGSIHLHGLLKIKNAPDLPGVEIGKQANFNMRKERQKLGLSPIPALETFDAIVKDRIEQKRVYCLGLPK